MERINKLLATVIIAASLLVFTTCDNPVDMLEEVFVEVMQSNDRYLEVNRINIPLDSNSRFSPTGTMEIEFDRDIDFSSVSPDTIIIQEESGTRIDYPLKGLAYIASSRTVRLRVYDFLPINSSFTLRVTGVKGLDGSLIKNIAERTFTTKNILAGSIDGLTGSNAASNAGYTISKLIDGTLKVNDLFPYIKYTIAADSGSTEYSSGWFLRPEEGIITLDDLDLEAELGVSDGPIELAVSFFGNTNNSDTGAEAGTQDSISIIMDRVPPATPTTPDLHSSHDTGSSSTDNITRYSSALLFSGTGEAGSTIRLMKGATTLGTATVATDGAWSLNVTLAEGLHTLHSIAGEASGNTSASSSTVDVYVDTTSPSISVSNTYDTNANNQSYLNSGSWLFTAAVTNGGTNPSTIQKVEFFKDTSSSGFTNLVGTDTISAYTWSWATAADTETTYYIKALVTDTAGNTASSINTRYLDKTAPSLSSVTNTYNENAINQLYLNSGVFTFTANVTNSGTNAVAMWKVEFYKDIASTGITNLVTTDTSSAYTWPWTTSAETDGTFYIKARAIDYCGNISTTSVNTRYLDKASPTVAPVFTSQPPNPTNDNTPTWSWSPGSGSGGSGYYTYRLGGASYNTPSATTSYTSEVITDQSYYFRVREHDYAGNPSPELLWIGTIDTTPPLAPSIIVTDPAGHYAYNQATEDPVWTWTGGGGGNGTFRWEFGDSTPDLNTNTVTTSSQSIDGLYTLYVQERDAAGNWSAVSSSSVRLTPVIPYNGATGVSRSTSYYWRDYATYHKVEMSPNGTTWATVYTGTATSLASTSLVAYTTYYYRLSSGTSSFGPWTLRVSGSFTTGK